MNRLCKESVQKTHDLKHYNRRIFLPLYLAFHKLFIHSFYDSVGDKDG